MNRGGGGGRGQVSEPCPCELCHGVVYGLTSVNVQMSFSLPQANFERRVTRLAEVTFLNVSKMPELPQGKSDLVHAHYQCLEQLISI